MSPLWFSMPMTVPCVLASTRRVVALRGELSVSAIVVDQLAKHYGKLEAVRGISFAVEDGEVFGFLGPNGAGKTTTINILCTLNRPTAGRAQVAGCDVLTQKDGVRRAIGLVFQDPTLDEYLTAEQNLRFHAQAYGLPATVWRPRM